MKAESMQFFIIPITKNFQGVPFAPNRVLVHHIFLKRNKCTQRAGKIWLYQDLETNEIETH